MPPRFRQTLFENAITICSQYSCDRRLSASQAEGGQSETITLPATANLAGSVTDDGLPVGNTVPVGWSKVSGPGTVTFESPSAAATKAAFSAGGEYVLRLSATDGAASGSADVTITVNTAPAVEAGQDQLITLPAAATLSGTASDDGLPPGSVLSVQWTKVSGPGSVAFADAASVGTTATFSQGGFYVLRLTLRGSELQKWACGALLTLPPLLGIVSKSWKYKVL